MDKIGPVNFDFLYEKFEAPISHLDCGVKCAPYNEHGVPFCCDTHHAVPPAYLAEWNFLIQNTDLWHIWNPEDPIEKRDLEKITPEGMILLECLGHDHCQRNFRSLSCRAFPFFPYVDENNEFIGLAYYWEYEERCWVINNLEVITLEYRRQFVDSFDYLFAKLPVERESYKRFSLEMRRHFARTKRSIPLLHRGGGVYKLSARTGRMRPVNPDNLPKFGPYKIAQQMPFPDEFE